MPMMYGFALDKSGTVVNRDVPALDVEAYKAAGYKLGTADGAPTAEEYAKSQQKAQNATVKADTKAKADK